MDALLRLVSLGSAARNSVKIKVRQPLAELKVQAGEDSDERARRRALRRSDPRGAERQDGDTARSRMGSAADAGGEAEHEDAGPEVRRAAQGCRRGPRRGRCRLIWPTKVREGGSIELPCGGETILLEPADLIVSDEGGGGLGRRGRSRDAGRARHAHHARNCSREGMARDVVRHVQELRKEADLEMEDRIVLYLGTESEKLRAGHRRAPRLHRRRDADGRMVVAAAHGAGRASGHGQGGWAAVDD